MARILAIDYGLKRTGIAVTDELQIIASGLTTVSTNDLIPFLQDYIKKEEIELQKSNVLLLGPTGSGKTVTLYTALNILNDEGLNISTVEDPVEIRVAGINQVQVNEVSLTDKHLRYRL